MLRINNKNYTKMNTFFEKLNPLAFVAAFSFGLFICHLTMPEPIIIIKHPTLENAGNIIYQGYENDTTSQQSSNCFKYIAKEVKCS